MLISYHAQVHGNSANKTVLIGKKNPMGKFDCDQCGKSYSPRGNLRQHMQIHTGHYRYYCQQCKKGFSANINYNDHMRAHQGLKFHCEYCTKTFKTQKSHRNHLLLHTTQGQ